MKFETGKQIADFKEGSNSNAYNWRPVWQFRCTANNGQGERIVTLAEARKVIAAAEKKAQDIQHPMNIAVVDEGGNLVSHVRMDGAWIGSIDISINKAFTSRAFDISTKDLAANSQPNHQFFGIHVSFRGRDPA